MRCWEVFSQRNTRRKGYGGMPLAGGVERFFCYDKRISHLPNVSLIEGIVIVVRSGANAKYFEPILKIH